MVQTVDDIATILWIQIAQVLDVDVQHFGNLFRVDIFDTMTVSVFTGSSLPWG